MLFTGDMQVAGLQNLHQYQCFEKTLLIITKPKKANSLLKFKNGHRIRKISISHFLKKNSGPHNLSCCG